MMPDCYRDRILQKWDSYLSVILSKDFQHSASVNPLLISALSYFQRLLKKDCSPEEQEDIYQKIMAYAHKRNVLNSGVSRTGAVRLVATSTDAPAPMTIPLEQHQIKSSC